MNTLPVELPDESGFFKKLSSKVAAGVALTFASAASFAAPTCTDTSATSICTFVDSVVGSYFADLKAAVFNLSTGQLGFVLLVIAISIVITRMYLLKRA